MGLERGWTYESNQVDVETTLAELLLELWIGHLWASLNEDKDSFLEVGDVAVVACCFNVLPGLSWDFVGDVLHGNDSVLLAFQGIVTLTKAVPADTLWALGALVTLFFTDAARARSLARLSALW